jgi:autotransporter translocation and assembly factor TamB
VRLVRWAALGLLLGVVLAALGILFLDRTRAGQALVLRVVLSQVQKSINGEITVDSVTSKGILGGATLHGVKVMEESRPFLTVDAVDVGYQWGTFASGDVILSHLKLHGPHLTLSRYPGEDSFNLDRIFASDDAAPDDTTRATRTVRFDDVDLVDGFVEILLPIDPANPPSERVITTTLPGVEGSFQRIWFEDIEAHIDAATLQEPKDDFDGPIVDVTSLAMVGHLYQDPFTLTQLEGTVAWKDGKLTIAADEMSLPRTRTEGTIVVDLSEEARGDRKGWAAALDLDASTYSLADLQWLLPALPDGVGEGRFEVRLDDRGQVRTTFSDATLALEQSRVSGDGAFLWTGGMRYQDVRLHTSPLSLVEVKELLPDLELPLTGSVEGDVTFDGTLENLSVESDVVLHEPGFAPTRGTVNGTFHLGERRGVTDLVADLTEVDYAILSRWAPASKLAGRGSAHVEASGSLDEGVRYEAQLMHDPGQGLPRSEIAASGTLSGSGEALRIDVDADVTPLSLTALRTYYPNIPVSGEVTGDIRGTGLLSDWSVTTDLMTDAGRLALEARFDARDPSAFYRVQGDLVDFALSELIEELPDPTRFSGFVQLEGRGTDPRTASIDALLRARRSRVWEVDVDTASVQVRVRDGVLYVDSADAVASGVQLRATGNMATTEEGPPGEIRVTFDAESLTGLRPVLMERNILVQDGLTEQQLESLRAQGVDPDTLPTSEDVMLGGRATGSATLTGSLKRFAAAGSVTLGEVRYGRQLMRNAELTFAAADLPDFKSVQGRVVADSLELFGRSFRGMDADVDFARPGGSVSLVLTRDDSEDYRANARFEIDSLGGRVDLESLQLRLDTLGWQLDQPVRISWDEQAIVVGDARLSQTGGANIQITASGVLPRQGEADFQMTVRGLELAQVMHLAQVEEAAELDGNLNVDLHVRGTLEEPFILGTFDAADVRFQGYDVQRVAGGLEFRGRRWSINLAAWQGEMRMFTATGTIPSVVNFREPALRFPDEEINLTVVADELPAAYLTGIFQALTEVEGTVAGRFQIAGTLDNPAPTGTLELQNAGWTLEALGVRHQNVRGTLTLRPDGTMEVDATGVAGGSARMTGTVKLAPLSNPTFDLQVSFDNFLAVDRRDAVGNVSGIVRLTGTFEAPLIEGLGPAEGLRVESGNLYLEEFVRTATVVDLSDPRFRELVDSTLNSTDARILEESSNPFMRNLRVEVDLAVEQDAWLRSSEMNVEIAGDLRVSYDRENLDIVLRGVLDARRGDYTVRGLGKSFQVREGQVEFLGFSGINPNLNITAVTRVRRQGGEQFDITAQVAGTLLQPRVTLSSDEAGVGEADLVSYLLFGRPSYELGAGQQAALGSAAQSYGISVGVGYVTSRVGSALAQQWGLDYFAITDVGNPLELGAVGSFKQSQIEFGKYLSQDLFLVLAFQPTQVVGSNPFGTVGTRLEFRPSDRYAIEAFVEDRFQRSGVSGFQDLGLARRKIFGLSLFSEWGF